MDMRRYSCIVAKKTDSRKKSTRCVGGGIGWLTVGFGAFLRLAMIHT